MNPQIFPRSPVPLSGARFALGAIAVALATFMNVLDSSISDIAPRVLNRRLQQFSKTGFAELKRLLIKFIGEGQSGDSP
ncbi:hypothetical protein ACFSHT_17270 [Paraburkholderia silviterrae]|uniref:Uncharacterized protein n=1 Tax=Paraburkholderia silviterrae TaxID=2528715 RepID=A0A4V2ZXY9_9BURK|nr:hypothetical protein [Paraburkholderia silviterrae]TDG17740.1 hypothetical protein EYW47_36585 [Paraburkholderia silviterrae]